MIACYLKGCVEMFTIRNAKVFYGRSAPAAIWALIRALKSSRADVRVNAATMLGEMKNRRTISFLANALWDEEIPVRIAAARALGNIGDLTALNPLMLAARRDRISAVRAEAVSAIGKIGDAQAAGFLVEIIRSGHEVEEAVLAFERIMECGMSRIPSDVLDDIAGLENKALSPKIFNLLHVHSPAGRAWMRVQKLAMREIWLRERRAMKNTRGGTSRDREESILVREQAEVFA